MDNSWAIEAQYSSYINSHFKMLLSLLEVVPKMHFDIYRWFSTKLHIFITNASEILKSCTKPSIWCSSISIFVYIWTVPVFSNIDVIAAVFHSTIACPESMMWHRNIRVPLRSLAKLKITGRRKLDGLLHLYNGVNSSSPSEAYISHHWFR